MNPDEISAIRHLATRAWQDGFAELGTGWQMVELDLQPLLAPFELAIDREWTLFVMAVRWSRDGEGRTVAVPASEADGVRRRLISTLEDWGKDDPPEVPEAAGDIGVALVGERSDRGLLMASLAARELAEVGASGHGRSWLDEQVVTGSGALPQLAADWGEPRDYMDWDWDGPPVDDWQPTVAAGTDGPQVTFYTYDPVGGHRLIRHNDRYGASGLAAARSRTVIARAAGGITP